MKYFIILALALFSQSSLLAQEKGNSKIKEASFEVAGVCNMCKERIETAALHAKGVKLADWDKQTKQLKVTYNSSKTDLIGIQSAVLEMGHDAAGIKADSANYVKLPACCAYRDSGLKTH